MIVIDTERGPAVLDRPRKHWTLNHNGTTTRLDADTEDDATRKALDHFRALGIGAGKRMTGREAAERANVTPDSWRSHVRNDREARGPDGWHNPRLPWWWETNVDRICAARHQGRRAPQTRETDDA